MAAHAVLRPDAGAALQHAEHVPLSALFWSLRRRRRTADQPEKSVPLDYGYFGVCLLAASSANPRTPGFFVGVCALALYALWPAAPRPHQRAAWLSLAAAGTALAFGIQAGLFSLQSKLEEAVFEWLSEHWNGQRDPYQARTAIGDLGMLKTSDRIVMRVEAGGATVPRLRSAAYSLYAAGAWVAPDRSFAPMTPVGMSWPIADGQGPRVRISTWMTEGRALLGLPLGTYRLDGLNVAHAERNTMGAVRVAEGPDTLTFDAWYDLGVRIDPAPTTAETAVPGSLALRWTVSPRRSAWRGDRPRRCASGRGILCCALRLLAGAGVTGRNRAHPAPLPAGGPPRPLRVLRHRHRAAA